MHLLSGVCSLRRSEQGCVTPMEQAHSFWNTSFGKSKDRASHAFLLMGWLKALLAQRWSGRLSASKWGTLAPREPGDEARSWGARSSVGWKLPSVLQISMTQQHPRTPGSVLGVCSDTQGVDGVEQTGGLAVTMPPLLSGSDSGSVLSIFACFGLRSPHAILHGGAHPTGNDECLGQRLSIRKQIWAGLQGKEKKKRMMMDNNVLLVIFQKVRPILLTGCP